MSTADNNQYLDLENILSFLGINFIDYKSHRTSNGHKTAKTIGQVKEFFGKEVMTSGQFIEDIKWWDFENNWNDLMFLVEKIESLNFNFNITSGSATALKNHAAIYQTLIYRLDGRKKNQAVYNTCLEFIKWYNEQKN